MSPFRIFKPLLFMRLLSTLFLFRLFMFSLHSFLFLDDYSEPSFRDKAKEVVDASLEISLSSKPEDCGRASDDCGRDRDDCGSTRDECDSNRDVCDDCKHPRRFIHTRSIASDNNPETSAIRSWPVIPEGSIP